MRKVIDIDKSYRLLSQGAIVLISSMYDKQADITPIAWVMPVSDEPVRIALGIYDGHYIYKCIIQTKDFVINIPDASMKDVVMKCGKSSGKNIDKFKEFNLEQEPSRKISSPRLKGSLAILECSLVKDEKLAKDHNVIIGEVKHAEVEETVFDKRWLFEKNTYKTLHHLGGGVFSTPSGDILKK